MTENLALGDEIFSRLRQAKHTHFKSAELMQLAYEAFKLVINSVGSKIKEKLTLQYPLGLHPDGNPIVGTQKYTKDEFIQHNVILAESALPIQGIYGLVTTMESMFGDLIKIICAKYPQKLGGKRTISLESIVSCENIEDVRMACINDLLNDLSYKSPRDFAQQAESIMSIKLLEIPEYHKYIELKATRDVHIHNDGIANTIYAKKVESHARVQVGTDLPVTNQYFLDRYEACLKLIEVMQSKFHDVWPSQLYIDLKNESKGQVNKPSE